MSLQGKNIKIFQITGKKPSAYNSIEISLHKPVPYSQTTANKIILANEPPFNTYNHFNPFNTIFGYHDDRRKFRDTFTAI